MWSRKSFRAQTKTGYSSSWSKTRFDARTNVPRSLRVEPLEQRMLLAVIDGSVPGEHVISGTPADDELTIDFSNGNAGGDLSILFDGGDGFDTIRVVGGVLGDATYSATAPEAGNLNLDGVSVDFSDVEPITVSSVLGTLRIDVSDGLGHEVVLEDVIGINDSRVTIDGGLEDVTFANPSDWLIINTGDGDDDIFVRNLETSFSASVLIDGGNDNDTFQVVPNQSAAIYINGGLPAHGDAGVPPGDVLALDLDNVIGADVNSGMSTGIVTSWSHSNVEWIGIEELITPDRFEWNDSIDQATVLGSVDQVTLNDLSIHPRLDTSVGISYADVIVVVDESESMDGEHAFLSQFIPLLEQGLTDIGIGGQGVFAENQYGLVGFGGEDDPIHLRGHSHLVGGALFGSAGQFATATGTLVATGVTEDGYDGIDFALNNYPLRPDAEKLVILVTDEDRDVVNVSLSFAGTSAALQAADVTLHGAFDVDLEDGGGTPALAIDGNGVAYVVDGSGGINQSTGGVATVGFGTTIDDYVDLVFDAGDGLVGDLNQLRLGGDFAESFSDAMLIGLISSIDVQPPSPDVDYYQYTAPDTGKLIINAFFDDEVGNLDMRVLDANGNVIATSATTTDNEQITIPVVSQEQYFIQISGFQEAVNNYDLEIENFAAPVPTQPDLVDASDTGMMNDDNVTADDTPTIEVTADLADFGTHITIDGGAGVEGADVVLTATSQTTGAVTTLDADRVSPTNDNLWTGTFGVLADDEYVVEAWVRIEDGQATPAVGRSQIGEPLTITIDTEAPTAPTTPDMLDASDDGVSSVDNITSNTAPAFDGFGESNTKVRLFADGELVGQSTVTTSGAWEITSEPLGNGSYTITAELEDAAGNVGLLSGGLPIVVDPYEPNDDIAEATILGSIEQITLNDVLLHNAQDVDYFKYTAPATGKVIVNAFSADEIGLRVRDVNGNIIETGVEGIVTPGLNIDHLVIPVVFEQEYFVEMHFTGDQPEPLVRHVAIYDLEIESFAAPVPHRPDLPAKDQFVILNDTGSSQTDDITFRTEPEIIVQADLDDFAQEGITILSAAQAEARDTAGAAVEVFVNGNSVGYADLVPDTGNTKFRYVFAPGELPVELFPDASHGWLHNVKAAVTIIDGQGDAEGLPTPADGRTQLSQGLELVVDEVAPGASVPNMLYSSDSGILNDDDITNVTQPAFDGIAEAGALVRVFANDELVGQAVVGSDETDGVSSDQMGRWEITVEPLVYGQHVITTEIEDLAGNIGPRSGGLTIVVDPYEPNDDIAEATILGSIEQITLNDVLLHNAQDVDYFKYTAPATGKVIVNAFSADEIGLRVRDVNGNIIETGVEGIVTPGLNIDHLVIPVVFEQEYFVEMHFTGDQPEPLVRHVAIYDLEIESFAAPVPHRPDLPAKDQFVILNDTGSSQTDDITFRTEPEIIVQADLDDFAQEGITILSAAQAEARDTAGAAVEVFVNGNSVGYADLVPDTGNTKFRYVFAPGELPVELFPDASHGWLHNVKAAVTIIDGQGDVEGLPTPADGRTQLSQGLELVVDTIAPDPSEPNMLDSSDSGNSNNDDVTNLTQPAFDGIAEAGAIVRVFANDELVGQAVVGSDETDGVSNDQMGRWEITIEPLTDGAYVITTNVEDLAGNISEPQEGGLDIWIDTIAPNTPYLDLVGLEATPNTKLIGDQEEVSDTGRHDSDNITRDNTPTVTVTADDTIDGDGNPFPNDIKYRIYDRPGDAGTDGEVLLVESWTAPPPPNEFSTEGFFVHTLSQLLNDDYDGTIDGAPLADGVHNLKLEVEDRAGNFSHDFLLQITIDTQAPPVSIVDIDPAETDTGIEGQPFTFVDRITSDTATGFVGNAEADAIVRLYVDNDFDDNLHALTVAVPLDGNQAMLNNGQWNTPYVYDLNNPDLWPTMDGQPRDGLRQVSVTAEDVAGNVSEPDLLEIFIDTRGPQVDNVSITGDDFDLFNPKSDPTLSDHGPTPLIFSLDIDFIDQPERIGETLIVGDDAVFVIDVSGSTGSSFGGSPVGDLNNDGSPDTVLDAEIAGFIALNQELIARGLGDTSNVSVVPFASSAWQADMDPVADGVQISTTPNADEDSNGIPDVEDALRALTDGGGTSFEPALQKAIDTINAVGTANGDGNVVFLSDGQSSGSYADEVAALQAMGHNLRAFGVGTGSSLPALQIIDPSAVQFTSTDELLDAFGGGSDGGGGNGSSSVFVYPAVNEILATTPGNIQVVGDANGIIAIESIEFLDSTVAGDIGRTTIRLNFFHPLPDDRFTLTVSDRITDRPGNALDGEANTAEPQEMPQFPSGDGMPGGDFVARFTVDSRPEIGTWAAGSIYIDTNGNFSFDPDNVDAANRDLAYVLGYTSDYIFAGNFQDPEAREDADGFDKLAAYGRVGEIGTASERFRWLIDTDNDGVPDLDVDDPAKIIGQPVAGNFDGDASNGDEVGLFTGTTWHLDTNHDFMVDTEVASPTQGYPIVGDFDGSRINDPDGNDDLATHKQGLFSFALWDGVGDWLPPQTIELDYGGFIGVRERPVAADMDMDGIDDIGLWTPDRAGAVPEEGGEWFFLISDETLQADGSVAPLDHPFSPIPLGLDLFAQFGDDFALPVVGNFDPPVAAQDAPVGPAIVSISGTSGNDTFELVAGSTPGELTVKLNGQVQDVAPGTNSLVFDGLGGYDSVNLVTLASNENDSAELWPDHGTFTSAGVTFTLAGVESINIDGGAGNDTVVVHDSAGDDELYARAATGAQPVSSITIADYVENDPAFVPTYSHSVANFENLTTDSTAGVDVASFFDSDDDDTLIARQFETVLSGDGFSFRAENFQYTHGYAKAGGDDTAELYDTPQNDRFKGNSVYARMFRGAFQRRAKFFETVVAYATAGGTDDARLFDSTSNDQLTATPTQTRLHSDDAGYDLTVVSFDEVLVRASSGFDTAAFIGGAGDDLLLHKWLRQDTLVRSPKTEMMDYDPDGNHGQVYKVTARMFDRTTAQGGQGGYDIAKFWDTLEADRFVADGDTAAMYNPSNELLYDVIAFDKVMFNHVNGGNDTTEKAASYDFLLGEYWAP